MKIERQIREELPEDVILFKREVFMDKRGFFLELLNEDILSHLPERIFPQQNVSYSHENVFRGLHYQLPPHGQGKLITCLHGAIIDFFMDLRKSSPTFKQIFPCILYPEYTLYLPPHYAHGFAVLKGEQEAILHYAVTSPRSVEHERIIYGRDVISDEESLTLSEKDLSARKIHEIPEEEFYA